MVGWDWRKLPEEPEPENHWANYVEYNKTLRTWFVSFGIGSAALLLVNPSILQALKSSGYASWVAGLLLLGCAFQVLIALINKTVAWHMYCGEQSEAYRLSRWYKVCEFLSASYWLDLFLDVGSLLAFVAAVVLLFQINVYDLGPIHSGPMPQ